MCVHVCVNQESKIPYKRTTKILENYFYTGCPKNWHLRAGEERLQRISSSNKRERTAEISAIAIAKKDQLRERINMAFGTFTPTKVYVAYM